MILETGVVRVAVAAVALLLIAPAFSADADVIREARDRQEIEELMWRYVRALDTLDAEAYASTYTVDGRFGEGANATVGHAALKQMIVGLREARDETSPPMYHVIANSYIEFLGIDEARLHSYWMTMFGPAESPGAPRVAAVGRGVDELVRVNGRWLIKSRNVAPQD